MSARVRPLDIEATGTSYVHRGSSESRGHKFDAKKVINNFEVVAEAAGGLGRLRELAIELAVSGLLLGDADPSSWKPVLLSDVVVDVRNGIAKRGGDSGRAIPVLRLADIEGGSRLRREGFRQIVLTSAEARQYRLEAGDILVIRVNGSASLVGRFVPFDAIGEWAYSDHLIRVRPNPRIVDTGFLCALARSAASRAHIVSKTVTTAGQHTINQVGLGSLPLLLPPLAEQKRIVAKVDQLMALCDDFEARQAKKSETGTRLTKSALEALTTAESPAEFDAAWTRVVDNFGLLVDCADKVSILRGAILALAIRGAATRSEPGDGDAAGLLARLGTPNDRRQRGGPLARDQAEFTIRPQWVWSSLGQLVHPDFPISYGVLVPGPEVADGVPFVRIQDLSVIAPPKRPAKSIDASIAAQYERTTLRGGEILLGVVGSIGKVGVAPSTWAGAAIARAVCRIMPHPEIDCRFLAWVIQSPLLQNYFLESTRTLAQPTLNVGMIRAAPVPLPPLAEQRRIVAKVEQLMKVCDDLETNMRRAEDRAAKLVEAAVQELVA